jgi:hypothetical protein
MEFERTCPSAPGVPGSTVLGVVTGNGRIAYVSPPVPVDDVFLDAVGTIDLEKRFRFAHACVEGGCPQWTGSRCSVIDSAIEEIATAGDASLPACTIRKTCRWFAQQGRNACAICPLVITDT